MKTEKEIKDRINKFKEELVKLQNSEDPDDEIDLEIHIMLIDNLEWVLK